MKSKISCFNKTIFLKNVTLYWPIWGLYLLYLMIAVPGSLWLQLEIGQNGMWEIDANEVFSILEGVINPSIGMWATFFMAIVTGMALHNYLFNAKNTNMIHALPVNRGELFGTNLASGLCFLFVPQILAFVVSVLVCLTYHVAHVQYLGSWLLVMMGTAFAIYSIVVFCAMITGQLFALPFIVIALNFAYLLFWWMDALLMEIMGYGMLIAPELDGAGLNLISWLSPMYCLDSHVYFTPEYSAKANGDILYTGFSLHGAGVLAVYAGAGILFLAAAYLIYRKRQLEQAGELFTTAPARLLFRWGCGFFFGYFIAMFAIEILEAVQIPWNLFVMLVFVLLFGWMFYLFAEMLVRKNFRVFKKRMLVESGIFLVFLLLTFGGMKLQAHMQEQYVPDADEIASASISDQIEVRCSGGDAEKVLEFHREILKNKEKFQNLSWEQLTDDVWVNYTLKNGKRIERVYTIPVEGEDSGLYQKLIAMELEPENFLTGLLGRDYTDLGRYASGLMEFYDPETDWYDSREFSADTAKKIAEALIADARTGALQKYNLTVIGETEEDTGFQETISLDYTFEEEEYDWMGNTVINAVTSSYYIGFGEDCTNLLSALVETGVIESEEELTPVDMNY